MIERSRSSKAFLISMKKHLVLKTIASCAVLFCSALQPTFALEQERIIGFNKSEIVEQLSLEARFAKELNSENLRSSLRIVSKSPHHTGSSGARAVAEFLVDRFRSWGFEADIDTHYGLMSTPMQRVVEMTAPHSYTAMLAPKGFRNQTRQSVDAYLPPYNVYSKDGDVSAEAVYVNYGLAEDYALLAKQGISVEGKIVIIRYGRAWRGAKPRLAARNGAIGAIMFSDPADYGNKRGKTYPEGPFLPNDGYQRGSVIDILRIAGDPFTPGKGADKKYEMLPLEQAGDAISPIPVLPLSADDVLPIMQAMDGQAAPIGWRGGLATEYRINGSVTLRMKVEQSWEIVPLLNVVAKLEGSTWPDEWVLRGNNHDAWDYGAMVPGSGLVAMLEEARAVGALASAGHRPKRTIVYLAWDGEELGLLGSTEWVESRSKELRSNAIAYLNSGVTTRGLFAAGGSAALEGLVNDVIKSVRDPVAEGTVYQRLKMHSGDEDEKAGSLNSTDEWRYRVAPLGLGSDYTPFLHHLGLPSLDYSFDGEAPSGVYHSIYDNFDFYDRFGDPGFVHGVKLSEAFGRTTLRLANSQILPFEYEGVVHSLRRFVVELETLLPNSSSNGTAAFGTSNDMYRRESVLTGLADAIDRLSGTAERFSAARTRIEQSMVSLKASETKRINQLLRQAEFIFAPESGLQDRPWYRHHLYAPSLETGYGVATLPSVRSAIIARDWKRIDEEQDRVAIMVSQYAEKIDEVSELLERASVKQHEK